MAQHARVPDRALARHRPRSRSTRRSCSGSAQTGSAAPGERTLYFPGPEFKTLHTGYDVKKANEMLDKLGLDKKDAEGYRLRTDGGGRLRLDADDLPRVPAVHADRRDDRRAVEEDRHPRRGAGDGARPGHRRASRPTSTRSTSRPSGAPTTSSATRRCSSPPTAQSPLGPLYGIWYSSAGAKGKKPPPRMRELMDKYRKAFGVPDAGADRLAKEVVEDRAGRALDHPGRRRTRPPRRACG